MSYCRWQNTLSDLQDCIDSFHDGVANKDEARARQQMVALAEELISLYRNEREMVDGLELNEEGRGYEDEESEVSEEG